MKMFLFNHKQKVKRWLVDKDFIEAKMTEQINAAAKLVFSVPLKKRLPATYFFAAIPQPRGSDYLLFKIVTEQVKSDRVQYTCIEAAYDELKSYHYIKDDRPQNRSAADMLQMALDGTRWSVGTAYDAGTGSTNFYYISSLEAIQKIADLFQLEVVFSISLDPNSHQIVRRLVNLYAQQGERTGKRFEYGSNLLSVEREESSENLITALIGRGKGEEKYHTADGKTADEDQTPDGYGRRINFADVVWSTDNGNPVNKPAGQEYVEDPDATAAYGFDDGKPRIGIEIFEDITDPGELLQATWSALQTLKRPKVSFKANTLDVGDLGLGDTVAIIRHDIKIEYFTRVYKVEHNLLNEKQNTIELGDDFNSQSITSAINSIASAVKQTSQTANYASVSANGKNTNNYGKDKPDRAVEGDLWYKDLGNGEIDLYQYHDGNWILITSTRDLHNVQKQVEKAQSELDTAKNDIIANKQKADTDIENLNKSIEENKKVADAGIDRLNQSIEANKETADESLQKLNDSVANLQGQYDNNIVPDLNKAAADAADALQKYIAAQKSIADLTKQAQQQGKDIADVTSTVNGLNINYANLAGDVNSTNVDVKGLQTTIGTATGDIAQLKVDAQSLQTMLAGKVDDSVYQNFVTLTNQALAAKLTASDLAGYAKTTDVQATAEGLRVNISSVTDRMNNLKIGSVNQLRNTDPDRLSNNESDHTWKVTSAGNGRGDLINLDSNFSAKHGFRMFENTNGNKDFTQHPVCWDGGKYTFTVWVRLAPEAEQQAANALIRVWNYAKGAESYAKIINVTSKKWQKISIKIDSSTFYKDDCGFAFGVTGEGSLNFAEPMLVTGEIPADWSPNPADLTTQVAFSELVQTVSGLQSTVSGNYGDLQSQISQTAQAINGELSNQITGVQNQITATANGLTALIQNNSVSLIQKGSFEDGSKGTWDYTAAVVDVTDVDVPFTKALQISSRDSFEPRWINVTPGDHYLVKAWLKSDEAQGHQVAAGLHVKNKNGSSNWLAVARSTNHDWKLVAGEVTIPDTAVAARGWLQIEATENFGHAYFANISITKISDKTMQLAATLDGLQSTVSSNYNALQSQISQTATTLRGEVTDQITGVQNQLTMTANGLNARIDNIRIGGRNLLRGTSDQWRTLTGSNWLYGTTATDMWTSAAYDHDGAQFTYSATITNTSEVPVRLALYCYDNDKKTVLKKAVGPTVGPNSGSIPTSVSITINWQTWFIFSDIETLDGKASQFSIQVKDEQLEKGNVRTAWTTNPDDIASQFTEVNATINGLQSTVGSNYSALQSQINQTATTIRGEVTNSVSGLQTQITQQANNFNVSLNSLRKETAWQKVTTAIDANNYTTTGNYWIQAAPNSNTPDGSAWAYLEVVAEPAVERIKQTWQRDNNANEAYTRLKTGNTWSDWQKTVTAGNIMAQINMSAGTTLIQNNKIYMDADSTSFSGKAFIPSAAITDLSADKITTGTLNAGNVNIINMNADNITAGTIKGTNLSINLNSGEVEFQHGRIHNFDNTVDINVDQAYISTASNILGATRALLKDGELQLTQPNIFDTNGDWYFRLFNGGGSGDAFAGGSLVGKNNVTVANKDNYQGATGLSASPVGTATFAGLFVGKGNSWMPTLLEGAERGVFIKGGKSISSEFMHGGPLMPGSPYISVGSDSSGANFWDNRIVIDAEYVHIPSAQRQTTGSSPNLFIADDGALVRSTSASKYKTDIQRSHSLDYGERLLSLPTATWIDKAESRRYASGESDMKPVTHFGMIAEDLAAAGLEMLVSRGQDGELEGIQYDRIAPALLPVIKKLQDRIKKLEERLNG